MASQPIHPTRVCRKCGIEKPLAKPHFQNTNGNPHTFRHVCWSCRLERQRERLGQSPAPPRRTPEEKRQINAAACRRAYAAKREQRKAENRERWHANKERYHQTQRRYYRENIEARKVADKAYREANKGKRREAHRRWSKANPDRIAAYCRNYQQSPAGRISGRERGRRWKERHADRIRAERREWYRANAEEARAYRRAYYAANREKFCELARLWREENKEQVVAWAHTRRVLTNTGQIFTVRDVGMIFAEQDGRCTYCQADIYGNYEVDHFIPIAQGGGNEPENIVLACMPCNRSKGAKMPWVWRPDLFSPLPE